MGILKFSSILITGLLISTTFAQARPDTRYMSCSQAQSLVQSNGAIILSTGAHTYNKFVKNHAYCNVSQELKRAFAPTTDLRRCKIGYVCKEKIFD